MNGGDLTSKEIFKPVACTTPLNACTFCGWPAELYSRSNADGTFSEKAVMCSNFGDDDPTGNACPLHLPPEDFYHATKREAVEYWNERTARGLEKAKSLLEAKAPPEATEIHRIALDGLNGNDVYAYAALTKIAEATDPILRAPVEPLPTHTAQVRCRKCGEKADIAIFDTGPIPSSDHMKLLEEAELELRHSSIFVRSREKMHPTGLDLYDDLLRRIQVYLGNPSTKSGS